jgi:diaminopimelate decarboxylase
MFPFTYHDGQLVAEQIPVAELARRFDTPLYVYCRSAIVDRCRRMEGALGTVPHLTCYAVKANANPALLRIIAGEGLGADVGSGGELLLALDAGFRPETITFSGVGKREEEIGEALGKRIRAFNVESLQEIEVLSALASAAGTRARILLRVNLDIDAGGHHYVSTSRRENKFGVAAGSAADVLEAAARLPGIDVGGVHSHIGSQIVRTETFLRAAEALRALVHDLRRRGVTVDDIDFGGGFGVQYRGPLRHPGIPPEEPEAAGIDPAEMVRGVLPILAGTGCTLAIQPGRSLVAEAGALLTRVLYRKDNGHKVFVVVDGGMNDLLRPSLYGSHHQVVPAVLTGAPPETVDVVGPVCESGDFFAQDRSLPRVERGDLLALLCAGAYGYVLSSNYNARRRPAEVLVDGSTASLIRPRESYDALRTPFPPEQRP